MKSLPPTASRPPVKFRLPTAENLVPIRLDIEIDGQRLKDAFTWNPSDPDSEVGLFARRTVKDLKLPPAFVTQIVQSINSQLAEFRSYEGQEMYTGEKIVPVKLDLRVNRTIIRDQFLWDLNNFESDPEELARSLCRDLDITDPEVGIAIQNVASARETRVGKKGRRGSEYVTASKSSGAALDVVKLFGNKASVIRKRKEWDVYEPIVDLLSAEEAEALDAREERNARMKKKLDDKDDGYTSRFIRG
ncbi:chromatin structure-remodeling complex protein BSH isoform X2 [Aristolochia californica]|uniref:chromatin structure-remodeling complex protein BSH isoform X2 n=1 Tax=Aristolochia californica TaxID=171875 RepID=UPI0035DE948E